MKKKYKNILTMFLSSLLFVLLFAVSVQAKETGMVAGIKQSSENPFTEEELKEQLYKIIKESGIIDKVPSPEAGMSMMDEANMASVSWPSDIPKPNNRDTSHITYSYSWTSRIDVPTLRIFFSEGFDPNSGNSFLIDPNNSHYADQLNIKYYDENGAEKNGKISGEKVKTVSYESYDIDKLVDGFYQNFAILYGQMYAYFEGVIMNAPQFFWATGEVLLAVPEIRIQQYSNGQYGMDGMAYFVLTQFDENGNKIFDFRHPAYQDTNKILATINEMNLLTDSIINRVKGQNPVEQMKYFNWYLTRVNELNTYHTSGAEKEALFWSHPDSYNCLAALRGTTGKYGPTDLSYARAFRLLCSRAGIESCIVAGQLGLLTDKSFGFWNMVNIDSFWYAVNTAWNDLSSKKGVALSGEESTMFLFTGMNTNVIVDGEEILFGLSHSEQNIVYTGFEFKNGPKLCAHEYYYPVYDINLTATETEYMYGYMEAPVITAKAVLAPGKTGTPSYSWIIVDPNGKETVLTGSENQITFPEVTVPGIYKIRSVAGLEGITTTKEISINVTIFQDVNESHWFYNAVDWAIENNITYGLNLSTFGSASPCTRAQIVTFLWRAAGSPELENTTNTFKDVTSDAYYYNAVLWAVENGITSGYNTEQFAPDNSCTRAEMVTFLWRVGGKKEAENKVHPYKDVKGDGFYYDAMLWAVEEGIAVGYTDTKFAPHMTVTRAETVTFLYRANGNPIETQKKNQPSKLFESKEMYDDRGLLYYVPNEYIEAGYMQNIIPFYNDFLITSSKVNDERRTVTKLVVFDTDSGKPIQETELISQEEFVIRVCGDKITAFDYVTGDVFILDTGLQILNKITCDYEACGAFVNQDVTKIYYFISDGIYQYDIKSKKTDLVYDKNIQMHDMRCFDESVTFVYEDDTTQVEHNAVFNISTGEVTELTLPSFMYDFWYMNDVWTGRIPEEGDKTYVGAKNDTYTVDMPEDSWWFSGSNPDRFFIKIRSLEYDSGISMYETDGTFVSKFDIPIDGNYDCYSMPDWVERDGGYYFIFTDVHNNDMLMYWDVSVPVEGEDLQLVKVEE